MRFATSGPRDEDRHRDGMSCQSIAAYKYDANGPGRWCIDCGAPLNDEQSWHPDGNDLPGWVVTFLILGILAVTGAAIILVSAMPYQ